MSRADLESHLTELRRKELALEDAYIYDQRRTIDGTTYERQRDKLREEIAIAEIEQQDARLDEIDVDGILGFAEHVLGNAARLWFEATPEQKQRLQRLVPRGTALPGRRIWNRRNVLRVHHFREEYRGRIRFGVPDGSRT